MTDDAVKFTDADKLAAARVVEADLRTQLAAALADREASFSKALRHTDYCLGIVQEACDDADQLRKALGEMIALVEQAEAFPSVIAQNLGLTDEGLAQLERARAVFAKESK